MSETEKASPLAPPGTTKEEEKQWKRKKGLLSTPEGWNDYSNFHRLVPGTRILPCRVPLKAEIRKEFTPSILIESSAALGTLRMVIDLTDTTRYYDGEKEFEAEGIIYKKLRCPGRCVPPLWISQRFAQAMNEFEEKFSKEKDAIVAVHCTHGVNRTGFVVASFLIHKGLEPCQAIRDFDKGRGHRIEKHRPYLRRLEKGWIHHRMEKELRRNWRDRRRRSRSPSRTPPRSLSPSLSPVRKRFSHSAVERQWTAQVTSRNGPDIRLIKTNWSRRRHRRSYSRTPERKEKPVKEKEDEKEEKKGKGKHSPIRPPGDSPRKPRFVHVNPDFIRKAPKHGGADEAKGGMGAGGGGLAGGHQWGRDPGYGRRQGAKFGNPDRGGGRGSEEPVIKKAKPF